MRRKTYFYCLDEKKEFIDELVNIYTSEWGWHFSEQWGISSSQEMRDEILKEIQDTYILLDEQNSLIATCAILEEDLKGSTLTPWFTCLYVIPEKRGKGYASYIYNKLIERIGTKYSTLYLWTYSEREKNIYTKWGWEILEDFEYVSKIKKKSLSAYLMKLELGKK